jgi:serine/threonine protein phosphatase 1
VNDEPRHIAVNPPPDRRIRRVPDDWTVWAFSDPHGVASGLEPALVEAGIVDEALRWAAPPRTALVGCGDYLDRGRESRRVVELLRRLEGEAEAAGGSVVLARGNHEHLLLHLAAGTSRDFATWVAFGGLATLAAWGIDGLDPADPRSSLRALDAVTPGVLAWLAGLTHAVRWRDVLFVHGGLPPGRSVSDLGRSTDDHLYVRSTFFTTPWSSGEFAGFEMDGVRRVVFGHTPRADGAEIVQGGRSINLDTNAPGNPGMGPDARRLVTLLELAGDVAFADARRVEVSTDGAPDASDAAP